MKLKLPYIIVVFLGIQFNIKAQVTASFELTDSITCTNQEVKITNTSAGAGNLNFQWDFGNLQTSTDSLVNPGPTYTTDGNYTIQLIVDDGTNSDTLEMVITINLSPTANFEVDNSYELIGCQTLTTGFTNTSVFGTAGSIDSSRWEYGDGDSEVNINESVVHEYSGSNFYYTPTLTVYDENGCYSSISSTNYVYLASPPKPSFNFDLPVGCDTPTVVNIINTTSYDYGTVSYSWDFGNGENGNIAEPEITFNEFGTFTVKGIATSDLYGCSDSTSNNFVIHNVIADGTINQGGPITDNDTVCPNLNINFTDASSGSDRRYWYIDNQYVNNNIIYNRFFGSAGTHDINLVATVTSNNYCPDTATWTLIVDPIKAGFAFEPENYCSDTSITTINNTSEFAVSYYYDLNDGTEYFSDVSSHNFIYPKNSDPYLIHTNVNFGGTQIVTSIHGCTDTVSRSFNVRRPTAIFKVDKVDGCAPLSVTFKDTSISNEPLKNITYFYDDGFDKVSSASQSHTFLNPGIYNTYIVYENDSGCIDTSFVIPIKVGDDLNPNFAVVNNDLCAFDTLQLNNTTTDIGKIDYAHYLIDSNSINSNPTDFNVSWINNASVGLHDVTLLVSYNGCISDTTIVDAFNSKGPFTTLTDSVDCNGNTRTIYFKGTSTSPASTCGIDFGEPPVSASSYNYTHTYTAPGDYNVRFFSADGGCIGETNILVKVRDVNTSITAITEECVNVPVSFSAPYSADYCKLQYDWNFGDSTQQIRTNSDPFFHSYSTGGVYEVAMAAEYDNGCLDTAYHTITITQPIANFVADIDTGCAPVYITFADSSKSPLGLLTQWSWDFDEVVGGTRIYNTREDTVKYNFNDNNIHNVSLTVTDDQGCQDTYLYPVYIGKPNPSFTLVDPGGDEICYGENLEIRYSNFDQVDSVLWNFNDGFTYNILEEYVSHPYETVGVFDVTLTAYKYFCDTTQTRPGFVEIQRADAGFTTSADTAHCYPATINFTRSNISITDNLTYWNFDDNGADIAGVNNTSHTYDNIGTYLPYLYVQSDFGCEDTVYQTLFVTGPSGSMSFSPKPACPEDPITFELENDVNVTNFEWVFENDTLSGSPVEYVFTSINSIPQLILYGEDGCVAPVITDTLDFHRLISDFEVPDTMLCALAQIPITNLSIGNTGDSKWYFDDLEVITDTTPAPEFSPGVHIISLVTYNNIGCQDSIAKAFVINDFPPFTISINEAIVCAGDSLSLSVAEGDSIVWLVDNIEKAKNEFSPTFAIQNSNDVYAKIFDSSTGCYTVDTVYITYQPDYDVSVEQHLLNSMDVDTFITGEWIRLQADTLGYLTYNWSPADSLSCANCPNPIVTSLESITYNLVASDTNNCFTHSYSIPIVIEQKYSVALPTAIVPDDDNPNESLRNDIVYVRGWGIKRIIEFSVYDRNGNQVFYANDYSPDSNIGWDGTKDGDPLSIGAYRYAVSVEYWSGQEESKSGIISIVK